MSLEIRHVAKRIPQEAYIHGDKHDMALNLCLMVVLQRLACNQFMRLPEDVQLYQKVQEMNGEGNAALVQEIKDRLGDRSVGFVKNIFPYTILTKVLSPMKKELNHVCLWSQSGSLPRNQICSYIDEEYPGRSAAVVVNNTSYRSVPELWHAHVIMAESQQK